jgi:hypothetical protein
VLTVALASGDGGEGKGGEEQGRKLDLHCESVLRLMEMGE